MTSLETRGSEGDHQFDRLVSQLDGVLAGDSRVATAVPQQTPNTQPGAEERLDELADEAPTEQVLPRGDVADITAAPKWAGHKAEQTIRVPVSLIEGLMNQVGELVLARNQLLQHVHEGNAEAIDRTAQGLDHITSRLQENVLKTRLQPVSSVFNKFPRIVRDLARMSGKSIVLEISGETTEVDKTLLEAITDPLTHIIRNAADHGIDAPAARKAAGKGPVGVIGLSASHEGERVIIAVRDDGAGLNLSKIKAKAVEKGLVSAADAERMTKREAMNLIFHAGLSTADQVTNISGRGVGMDAVKSAIERVNGTIEVDTTPGRGTTFRLEIPLTLAIIPALHVRVGGEQIAIPQVNTVEVVHYEGEAIGQCVRKLHGVQIIQFRGEWIPIVNLTTFLGLTPDAAFADEMSIVVVRSGVQQLGLIVDRVIDTEEIVVKPLISHLRRVGCYAGTTLGSDGRVALILDVAGTMRMNRIEKRQSTQDLQAEAPTVAEKQALLLCHVGGGQRVAVPLILVSRVEEIAMADVQTVGGRLLVPYWDGLLRLLRLSDHAPVAPLDGRDTAQVLVMEFGARRVGLLIDSVIDAVQYAGDLDDCGQSGSGVLATLLIDRLAVLLLDVYAIVEAADPTFFKAMSGTGEQRRSEGRHVLLAEDSAFFRRLVTDYLKSAGYQVHATEDGEEALRAFQQGQFDAIVTDLEMPKMDGFTFTQEVRKLPHGKDIPILAVSSLSSDDAKARAKRAGVDAYRVKLDRETLLSTLAGLIEKSSAHHEGAA